MSRPSLWAEIASFLSEHGPSTASAVAIGVRVRRADVDDALGAGPFLEAVTPEGGNTRARYWTNTADVSRAVPSSPRGSSRAALMLAVLGDGRKHSRDEIFASAGRFFLTNNAASELRAQGHDVQHGRLDGLDVYWLASSAQPEPSSSAAPPLPAGETLEGSGCADNEAVELKLFEAAA